MLGKLRRVVSNIVWGMKMPDWAVYVRDTARTSVQADNFSANFSDVRKNLPIANLDLYDPENPLRAYFDSYKEGNGIFKWYHYFDIYHWISRGI